MVVQKLIERRLLVVLLAAFIAALLAVVVSLQWGSSARAAESPSNVIEFDTDVNWDGVAAEEGIRDEQIVGGTAVPNGRFGFVTYISILYRDQFNRQFLSSCTGSLIDRDSVLTAAHCLEDQEVSGGTFTAVAARTTSGRAALSDSSRGQIRDAVSGLSHPRYNGNASSAYDANVLKLEAPVTGITPVRLSTAQQNHLERAGRKATAAGWGDTSSGGTSPDRMRQVSVPVRADSYGKRAYGSSYFSPIMVAAGAAGKDTCQGDSGGPLFAPTGRVYTQIGVTSFGRGCGLRGFPGVYTEVNSSLVRSFIVNAASS